MITTDVLEQILDVGRWAPSGDNTQPWRFEIAAPDHVVVHGFDTRAHCVYDLDGHPSQIAIGALIETITIAASAYGLRVDVRRRENAPENRPTIDLRFAKDASVVASPLISAIKARTVQRRPMRTVPLAEAQTSALSDVVGPGYELIWYSSLVDRWRVARIMFRNAKARLIMEEAFEVHRSVIEWGSRYSEDRIPDQAIGLDPMTMKLMRWVMKSWSRVEFMNKWLAGTVMPRVQLDLVPGLACAAHVGLVSRAPLVSIDEYVAAGRVVQRFWLEATRLGLMLQPEMTPVIFGRYCREGRKFTTNARAEGLARQVESEFKTLVGADRAARVAFFARTGSGREPRSRSLRLPVSRLGRWQELD